MILIISYSHAHTYTNNCIKFWGANKTCRVSYHLTSLLVQGNAKVSERNKSPPQSLKSGALPIRLCSTSFKVTHQTGMLRKRQAGFESRGGNQPFDAFLPAALLVQASFSFIHSSASLRVCRSVNLTLSLFPLFLHLPSSPNTHS